MCIRDRHRARASFDLYFLLTRVREVWSRLCYAETVQWHDCTGWRCYQRRPHDRILVMRGKTTLCMEQQIIDSNFQLQHETHQITHIEYRSSLILILECPIVYCQCLTCCPFFNTCARLTLQLGLLLFYSQRRRNATKWLNSRHFYSASV